MIILSQRRTIERLKQKSRHLKIEIYALYLAYRDPRVPWYAKAFVALVQVIYFEKNQKEVGAFDV